jgi:TetR/AcrR family transcriptional repressor of nem operon
MGDSDRRYGEIVDRLFDRWIGKIEKFVAAAQERGELRTDIPANALARNIVAVIEGGIMMSRVRKDEGPLRECLEVLRKTLDPKG